MVFIGTTLMMLKNIVILFADVKRRVYICLRNVKKSDMKNRLFTFKNSLRAGLTTRVVTGRSVFLRGFFIPGGFVFQEDSDGWIF